MPLAIWLGNVLKGDLGQSISRVVSDSFTDFNIYGTDTNTLNSGCLFCKEMHLLPIASDSKYISKLIELMSSLKINLLIPSTEQEQHQISQFLIIS